MTAATITLTGFLLRRIADDEAVASRGGRHNGAGVFANDNYGCLLVDPARIAAECESKRAIVEAHLITTEVLEVSTRMRFGYACETCFKFGDTVEDFGYCDTLRALASVYADHDDFDPAWS